MGRFTHMMKASDLGDDTQISSVLPGFGGTGVPFRRLLGLDKVEETKRAIFSLGTDGCDPDAVLDLLGVRYECDDAELLNIPQIGKAVVTANHPFGLVEGVILCSILQRVRSDFKIMANHLLQHFCPPDYSDRCILVDPFGTDESVNTNIGPMRESLKLLKSGGLLGVFPSGTVSHLHLRKRQISDPPWSDTIARIVRRTEASVTPLFFHGRNSTLFQLMGVVHPRLRTLMLLRELFNKEGETIRVRIGRSIPFAKLAGLDGDERLTQYMRLRTYMLEKHPERPRAFSTRRFTPSATVRAIIPPVPSPELEREIAELSASQILFENGHYAVCHASASQIPNLLREIGRLRETTFRAAGEGTGKALDLDRFDERYTHLFLWHRDKREVVGGYRLGHTDAVLPRQGIRGLYTSTLFHLRPEFLSHIGPALELGRSFIRPEYQKDYHPLMLLWKGVGRLVAQNPQYRILFGPVSISNDYTMGSRELIVAFSKANNQDRELAGLIRSRRPVKHPRRLGKISEVCSCLSDLQELSDVVSELEEDGKGVPVLVKHYVKLGGRFVGFNVDRKFNNALDGLIVVDLARTDRRILERYMGSEGTESFLTYHRELELLKCA